MNGVGKASDSLREEIFADAKTTSSPLMVFGSYARGDETPRSDIDVLELANHRQRPYRVRRINFSVYDAPTLTRMAERGSLFVLHLRLEGKILRDNRGELKKCLDRYRRPANYEPFRSALRQLANLLDIDEQTYEGNSAAYNELLMYIFRSEIYARLDEKGHPTFSLRAIVHDKQVHETVRRLLQSRDAADYQWFANCRSVIANHLGTTICNPYGGIEALVANAGAENPLIVAFGLRILGRKSFELTYDLLTAPPFT